MHFITFLIKNLLRRKARTILTCLGIGVAVGTTISLIGISENFRNETASGFKERGVHIVVIQKVLDQLTSDLPQDTGKIIIEQIPEVKETAGALIDVVAYNNKDPNNPNDEGTDITLIFQGWDTDSFLFEELKILTGRKLLDTDDRQVIIGNILSDLLKKNTGDTLEVQGEDFEIVGVFESSTLQENRSVILNLPKAQDMFFREKRITGLSIRLKDKETPSDEIKAVAARINKLDIVKLDGEFTAATDSKSTGFSIELDARAADDYVNNSMHIQIAQSMAWLTSIIAIFVGAIGMLNTMVMSVVERVKEISILRAIGWKRSRIVKMIVGESLLLTLGGTILGAIGACVLVMLLVKLPQVAGYLSATIPLSAYLKGSLLALLVGLLGGLYPAIRAAQLMPSEGLRHE